MNNILQLDHVTKIYSIDNNYDSHESATTALNDVSLCIPSGSFTGIMGTSGSGKSTLLNLISTIDTVSSGEIIINGRNLSTITSDEMAEFRRETLGFVFQEYNLLDTLTLRENIALALTIKSNSKADINSIIDDVAEKLNIKDILGKFPYQVSGGQRQRCACARAIATKPQLILADEPTGALDTNSAKNLMNTLAKLNAELGITILMVTHDAFSASFCNKLYFMQDGKIIKSLCKNNLSSHEYLLKILDSMITIAED